MEIYGQYEIKDPAGSGGCGQVFLAVKANDDKDKKAYILKTVNEVSENLESDIQSLRNEIRILLYLNNPTNPFQNIPLIYDCDGNNYKKEDEKECKENKIQEKDDMEARPYYVTDYFTKQSLYYYVVNNDKGFSEKHAKVIFKKIVEALKYCHDRNICHLDIKPCNIMFDNKFEPVIIDFGYATEIRDQNKNIKKLDKFWGTKEYKCPEIWEEKEYSGEKADIFSLGVVLFNLVTGRIGFQTSKTDDEIYNLIIEGEKNRTYENYWDIIKGAVKKLSENFKNLYIKMVAYNPENRPTTQQILDNPWFEEINNLTNEKKIELDDEVKKELDKIYINKIRITADDDLILSNEIVPKGYDARGIDDEIEETFSNKNLRAKKIPNDKICINHYIIIKGGYLEERGFMNRLCSKINECEKLGENFYITASENKLKFRLSFGEDEKRLSGECIIDVELFQYEDGRYLLEFLRKSGEIPDYYQNFLIIKDIIKNELNNLI